jgi:hypothetical protein
VSRTLIAVNSQCQTLAPRATARCLFVSSTRPAHSHRFARPLTTSALLPINLNRPMTFFRHVPMLSCKRTRRVTRVVVHTTHRLSMSLCSASLRINTSSSMLSTSYSMLWMSGPNASVMSSMSA